MHGIHANLIYPHDNMIASATEITMPKEPTHTFSSSSLSSLPFYIFRTGNFTEKQQKSETHHNYVLGM